MVTESATRPDSEAETANELETHYLEAHCKQASQAALVGFKVLEDLRIGHGLLTREQFAKELRDGNLIMLALPRSCYALVSIGSCEVGLAVNILTTTGNAKYALEGLLAIERFARDRQAKMVISVGRPGWTKLAESQGYSVQRTIIMKKVL